MDSLTENEKSLLSQITRLTAERDRLLAQQADGTPEADPSPPASAFKVVPVAELEPDDVLFDTGLPVGSLWRFPPGWVWLHSPSNLWDEGYQPLPIAEGTNDCVRVVAEKPPRVFTAEEAELLGFTVDRCCYPWCAYKGPRFDVTETLPIITPEHRGA